MVHIAILSDIARGSIYSADSFSRLALNQINNIQFYDLEKIIKGCKFLFIGFASNFKSGKSW